MNPTGRPALRLRRPVAVLAIAVAVALGTAGCGTVRATLKTDHALTAAGYTGVKVRFEIPGGINEVTVSAGAGTSTGTTAQAAEIVWRNEPLRFDRLVVSVRGRGAGSSGETATFTYDELRARLGPRPGSFDRSTLTSDVRNTATVVAVVFGVLVVVSGGVIVLIVVLVTRSRRQRQRELEAAWAQVQTQVGGGWSPPPPPGQPWPPPAASGEPWPPPSAAPGPVSPPGGPPEALAPDEEG